MDRPMAPDEALYELGKELDAVKSRVADAEALLLEVADNSEVPHHLARRCMRFLEGK